MNEASALIDLDFKKAICMKYVMDAFANSYPFTDCHTLAGRIFFPGCCGFQLLAVSLVVCCVDYFCSRWFYRSDVYMYICVNDMGCFFMPGVYCIYQFCMVYDTVGCFEVASLMPTVHELCSTLSDLPLVFSPLTFKYIKHF